MRYKGYYSNNSNSDHQFHISKNLISLLIPHKIVISIFGVTYFIQGIDATKAGGGVSEQSIQDCNIIPEN